MIDEGRLQHSNGGRSAPGGITVVLSQDIELASYEAAIEAGERPRHVLLDLARRTGGTAVTSHGATPSLIDRVGGRLIGDAAMWWTARKAFALADGGYIHANNEGLAFALLALNRLSRSRSSQVGCWVMAPAGPRVRRWLTLIRLLRLRPLLLAESERKAVAMRGQVGPSARVRNMGTPMDLSFFSPRPDAPADPEPGARRPLVVSAGLEQRDYRVLAAALADLDVEVRICAVSPDARTTSASLPDVAPANTTFVDLDMVGLRDLYRAADLVVIPTRPNGFDAGGSVVMEALSCGRPVIASDQGMFPDFAQRGVLRVATVGSAPDLRRVVLELLASPDERQQMGLAARSLMESAHSDRDWMDQLMAEIGQGAVGATESEAEIDVGATAPAGGLATG